MLLSPAPLSHLNTTSLHISYLAEFDPDALPDAKGDFLSLAGVELVTFLNTDIKYKTGHHEAQK